MVHACLYAKFRVFNISVTLFSADSYPVIKQYNKLINRLFTYIMYTYTMHLFTMNLFNIYSSTMYLFNMYSFNMHYALWGIITGPISAEHV